MRRPRLYLAAALSALLIAGWAVAPASALERPAVEITFAPDDGADVTNPERGFFLEMEPFEKATKATFGTVRGHGWSLVHGVTDLSAFTESPISDEWLNGLRTAFAAMRESGIKAIMRFSYSPKVAKTVSAVCPDPYSDPAPGSDIPPDASLETITGHLEQLRPILAENADVITAFDAGFIGTWGEWHCSTNHLATLEGKTAVLEAVKKAFPPNRQIGLRYPADIIDLVPDSASPESRIGSHQDCYAASVPDDAGTWVPPFQPLPGKDYSVENEKAVISALGERHIVGGEACKPSPRTVCEVAEEELPYLHFSYMSGDFNAEAIASYGPQCWSMIGRNLGYRFQFDSARIPDRASPGEKLPVSFTVSNTGFATPYNPRPVFISIEGSGYEHMEQVQVDPRTWRAGTPVTVDAELHLPADMPKGQYRVSVWMPDESPGLRSNHAYSVQFVNPGVWDKEKGVNVLTTLDVRELLPATGGTADIPLVAGAVGMVLLFAGLMIAVTRPRRRV